MGKEVALLEENGSGATIIWPAKIRIISAQCPFNCILFAIIIFKYVARVPGRKKWHNANILSIILFLSGIGLRKLIRPGLGALLLF